MTEPLCPPTNRDVTIATSIGTVRLELEDDASADLEYNLADVIGMLVRPALLAAGYSAEAVGRYVPDVYG